MVLIENLSTHSLTIFILSLFWTLQFIPNHQQLVPPPPLPPPAPSLTQPHHPAPTFLSLLWSCSQFHHQTFYGIIYRTPSPTPTHPVLGLTTLRYHFWYPPPAPILNLILIQNEST